MPDNCHCVKVIFRKFKWKQINWICICIDIHRYLRRNTLWIGSKKTIGSPTSLLVRGEWIWLRKIVVIRCTVFLHSVETPLSGKFFSAQTRGAVCSCYRKKRRRKRAKDWFRNSCGARRADGKAFRSSGCVPSITKKDRWWCETVKMEKA